MIRIPTLSKDQTVALSCQDAVNPLHQEGKPPTLLKVHTGSGGKYKIKDEMTYNSCWSWRMNDIKGQRRGRE